MHTHANYDLIANQCMQTRARVDVPACGQLQRDTHVDPVVEVA